MEQEDKLFNAIIDLHKMWFNQIKLEWGTSTVQLKKYLETYYHQDKNYAHMSEDRKININYILPYKKPTKDGHFNGLYGQMARTRLGIAILAKAYIMQELGNTTLGEYGYECLRLYTRTNSCYDKEDRTVLKQLISFEDFENGCLNAWNKAGTDKEGTKQYLEGICSEYLKNKRKQTIYHYKAEDFDLIQFCKSYKEAYNKWIEQVFPNLLNRYKERTLAEYRKELALKCGEDEIKFKWLMNEKYHIKEAEVKQIKIRKLSYKAFKLTLKRLNITLQGE